MSITPTAARILTAASANGESKSENPQSESNAPSVRPRPVRAIATPNWKARKILSRATARPGETGFGRDFTRVDLKVKQRAGQRYRGALSRALRSESVEQIAAIKAPEAESAYGRRHAKENSHVGQNFKEGILSPEHRKKPSIDQYTSVTLLMV